MAVYTCRICRNWHEKHWQMLECEKSHGDMTAAEYDAQARGRAKAAHDKFEARAALSARSTKERRT